jgi:hypothetical protein
MTNANPNDSRYTAPKIVRNPLESARHSARCGVWGSASTTQQALTALWRQIGQQLLDLIQHPGPFGGQERSQLLRSTSHPTPHMELGHLLLQSKLLGHHSEDIQIIGHQHAHPQLHLERQSRIGQLVFPANWFQQAEMGEVGGPGQPRLGEPADG